MRSAGRTQRGRGTFWTWREQMYAVAERLDPDSYLALATVTFREMVAAGITCVGEFHYLHHQPDGTPYDDPNAMGQALLEAARAAGLRITLLDTCYLTAGIGRPVEGVQRRFSDGDVDGWGERVAAISGTDGARIGGAYHSVRAVPRDQMRTRHSRRRCTSTSPSRWRRTSSAWRRTASPRRRSSRRPAISRTATRSSTRRTSPTTTSG